MLIKGNRKGGSLTLLPVLPGVPATGQSKDPKPDEVSGGNLFGPAKVCRYECHRCCQTECSSELPACFCLLALLLGNTSDDMA